MGKVPLRIVRHYEPDTEAMLAALTLLLRSSTCAPEDASCPNEVAEEGPREEVDDEALVGVRDGAEGIAAGGV